MDKAANKRFTLRDVTLRYDTYSLIADDQEDSRSEVASEDIALDR
jgi:hypothetical protein